MKKIVYIALVILFVFSLTACNSKELIEKIRSEKEIGKEKEKENDSEDSLSKSVKTENKVLEIIPKVYAGDSHSLALKTDGTLWSWGSNFYGQLGNGEHTTYLKENVKDQDHDQSIPIKIMEDIICAAAGTNFSLAVTKDHDLYGWGSNMSGQLGMKDIERALEPVKIMKDVIYVETSNLSAAIIKEDNSLWLFGKNYTEQFYSDNYQEATDFTATPKKLLDNIKEISIGTFYGMALTLDGELFMWGESRYLGENYENGDNYYVTEPVKIMDNVINISGNSQAPMIVTVDGDLYAWGFDGYNGSLGIGTEEFFIATPQLVMHDVKKAVSCSNINMAIKEDDSLWAWGSESVLVDFYNEQGNSGGAMLNEYLVYGNRPVKIMENIIWANGNNHFFAIDSENMLWGWGRNQFGTIGDGTVTTYDYEVIGDGEYVENRYFPIDNNEKAEIVQIMSLGDDK